MADIRSSLAQTWVGIALAFNMLWCVAVIQLCSLIPMGAVRHQQVSLFLVQLCWRLSLFFAPWMRSVPDDDYADQWAYILNIMAEEAAEAKEKGTKPRPLFILGNHASFLDTILAVCKMPTQVLVMCRTYMDHHLFKLPVLSTICKAVGHFPVYFKSNEDGKFSVDVERMVEVEQRVEKHLGGGGWLCFFPEGAMNGEPDKLMPFRFGGMKTALKHDAHLICLVFHGNNKVWPRKCKIGGFPGTVRYSVRPVAPSSAKAFVEMARAEGAKEEKDMADHEILARRLHELMQAQYDALAREAKNEVEAKAKAVKGKAD